MLSALELFINNRYGSKRGLLNNTRFMLRMYLGSYRHCRRIDFQTVGRLVFVCAGNICRSPLGEGLARQRGVEAVSYGLKCRGGDPADPRAQAHAGKLGIDLTRHVTRHIERYQPRGDDLLVVMEPDHLPALGTVAAQKTLATLWLPAPSPYLHDPYCANSHFFERCGNRLELAVAEIVSRMAPEALEGRVESPGNRL